MWQKGDGSSPKDDSKKDVRKFLDTHPSRMSNLQRTTDRSGFETGGSGGQDWRVAVAQQVLTQMQQTSNEEPDADWMSKLKEDSMQFLAEKRGVQLQQIYRESIYKGGIAILIDKIYTLLQRYTFEFNQVAAGTELHVSGTISGDVTEVTRYNRMREAEEVKTYFRARFSTRVHSLVMRGTDDSVDFYVVPTNKVMALSNAEKDYKPISTIQVKITDQGMMWRMAKGIPPVETLDELSMWLFGQLIQETKSAIQELKSAKTEPKT